MIFESYTVQLNIFAKNQTSIKYLKFCIDFSGFDVLHPTFIKKRDHQMIVRPHPLFFSISVSIAETSWQPVRPGPSLCTLQLLFSRVDVA